MAKRKKIQLPEHTGFLTDYEYFKKHFFIPGFLQEYRFVDNPEDVLVFVPLFGAGRFVLHFEDRGQLFNFATEGKKLRRGLERYTQKYGPMEPGPGGKRYDVRKVETFILTFIIKCSQTFHK